MEWLFPWHLQKTSLWASARKFLTVLCRKMLDLLKDVRAVFPAIQASVVASDFLKNNSNTSKSSLACSCQTPGVGVQACSIKILLNSADAASPPSLLLFTIPPTPRWSCCRLCWGWGCAGVWGWKFQLLPLLSLNFATSDTGSHGESDLWVKHDIHSLVALNVTHSIIQPSRLESALIMGNCKKKKQKPNNWERCKKWDSTSPSSGSAWP